MGSEEAANKVFEIFIARSSQLYSDDDTLMWLREIIGFVLTKIGDDDTIQGMLKMILGKDSID